MRSLISIQRFLEYFTPLTPPHFCVEPLSEAIFGELRQGWNLIYEQACITAYFYCCLKKQTS